MNKLVLATGKGVVIADRRSDEWEESSRGLADHEVTCVAARPGLILAGTTDGIFRSEDEGGAWEGASQGLTARHLRWMKIHPDDPDIVYAGTEPANIFVSHDGGKSWLDRPEVAHLRDKFGWSMPYSPEAGCVRGFAINGSRIYAAVEVGGALRSDDRGNTWDLAKGSDGRPDFAGPPPPFVYPDVHSIEVHPSSAELVYAPTGGGFYRSRDGGETWDYSYDCYCRAVWVDPEDPEHLILGPADYVDSNGRIEESHDGGENWSMASNGRKVPWRRHMVERFLQMDAELLAVLSNGEVLSAPLSTLEWRGILPDVKRVHAIAHLI